jgi:hypothetical protein
MIAPNKYKTRLGYMITSGYEAFLNAYTRVLFNREGYFAYDAFIPESLTHRDTLAQTALKTTAHQKFKIAKKIRAALNKIVGLFGHVSQMENTSGGLGLVFSDQVDKEANRFFADLTNSINSLGSKDSVTFVSIGHNITPVLNQYANAFNQVYLKRLESLYRAIETEVAQGELVTPKKEEYAAARYKLTNTFSNYVLRFSATVPHVFFSQNSHNTHFSRKSLKTANKTISDVAAELTSGELEPQEIPLSVYPTEKDGEYFAINNRTLTAYSQAQISPRRIVPVLPTTEEALRPATLEVGGESIVDESSGYVTLRVTP